MEGGVSVAARRRLSNVRVRLPRGQLGDSQFHRDVAVRATPASASNPMTKPGDPKRPATDERDLAIARLEKALNDALERGRADEALIEDQRQRLKTLGLGREESMRALADARDELKRVSRERDELHKQLARLDGMQSETITLPDDFRIPGAAAVPSLDDLMGALGDIEQPQGPRVAGHLHQRVQAPSEAE